MKVTLIDVMGNDLRVVNAARVSFLKESEHVDGEPCSDEDSNAWKDMTGETLYEQVLSEPDQKLINYLAKHNHWTPFSHIQITLRERVPIFVARQRFKHMVGFTYNEVSRRYVDDVPDFYVPQEWRGRPVNAKQGSSEEVIEPPVFTWGHDKYGYNEVLDLCQEWYEQAIKKGIAPEQARMVLPQSMFTEYYTTGSLAAWARAYRLRSDSHSQKEIQDLARMWQEVIGGIKELEYSWKALTTWGKHAKSTTPEG